jgi:hypothetical protein
MKIPILPIPAACRCFGLLKIPSLWERRRGEGGDAKQLRTLYSSPSRLSPHALRVPLPANVPLPGCQN